MKEFHTAMLVHEMYIPRVMNHSQQMEEEKKMGEIERKRGLKMNDDDSTHERSDGYCLTKYRQRFFKKDSSHARRCSEDKTSNPKLQGISSESLDPTFPRCGKRHDDWCLGIIKGCFSCGESGFKMRNCAK